MNHRKSNKQYVDETSKLRNVTERDVKCWKHLIGKQPKTTSEWPQSGPVIPLSS